MIAYKFLADGAIGPFTGFQWPRPDSSDPWVSAPADAPDDLWIHACCVADLPYWLGAELWRVELDEPVVEVTHQVASRRGRLVERVMGWTRVTAAELALDCALRARDLAAPRLTPSARGALLAAGDAAALESASGALAAEGGEAGAYVHAAASNAARGAVAVSAFVVETFARAVGGDTAGEREREHQARWLAERLQLRDGRGTGQRRV